MKWLRELYVGEKISAKAGKLLRAAERGKQSKLDGSYLITLSVFPKTELDLISLKESRSKIYQGERLTVLGMAADYNEALTLLEKMTNDCLKATGTASLKSYFSSRPTVSWREVSV